MSERGGGGGFGSFLFGIAVGAVVGFFFAPEAGEGTRRKVSSKLRNLRDLAEEKVDEVRGLLAEAADAAEDEAEDAADDAAPEASTREQLRRRLQAARRRRGRAGREEEDEAPPLA